MCGILGTVNLDAPSDSLDLIRHRGPDAEGTLSLQVGGHRVFLGHRRLSIVDLSPAGSQPMQARGSEAVIVYNGEVYNHAELRRQLPGASFTGHSDTETVLQLFAARGIEALPALNGIFALALVDTRKRRLYLARDPFGVKPLYYCAQQNSFAFCSELRPLTRLMPQTLSADNLATLLRLRYSPSPDTLFRDIRKLRPGHLIEVDLSGDHLRIQERPYLEPPALVRNDLRLDEATAQYQSLLRAAIERQLMSDVEVGILLSGGVDSAVVAKLAQDKSSAPLKAFTVGFTEADASDEVADAAASAATIGLDHHVVRMGFDDFLGHFAECVRVVEEPLATTSIIPMRHLSELAAGHVKVVLSGQGADEPLGGYRRYQGELLRRFVPPAAAAGLGRIAAAAGIKSESLLRALPAFAERDDVRHFCHVYEVFSAQQVAELIGVEERHAAERVQYFYDLLGCAGLPDSAARMMAIDLRMNLADDLLLYSDKITMRHSLECRVPLLDLELIRFVESLPTAYRVRLREGKRIHKRAAERLLPASIVHRRKKGFMSPTSRWFREKADVRELLLDPGGRLAGLLDPAVVRTVLDEHARGLNRERHIFLLLGLHYWLEEFGSSCRSTA